MAALAFLLRQWRTAQRVLGLVGTLLLLVTGIGLLASVWRNGIQAAHIGNWPAPFDITLVADLFSAVMVVLAGATGVAVTVYSLVTIDRRRESFGYYPLLLILLMGVCGAFLTGDLFNLYVWFEVMLISSFGLMVLGGKPLQLDATVKYGILNFLGTTLFLLGLGLLYGVLGTLNMADIVRRAASADPAALTTVAALFALAFGIKSAVFPVNAWLPASYHAPPAVISALMGGLLTKVGAYALLRTLLMLMPAARETLGPVLMVVLVAGALLGPLSAIAETNLRRSIGFILLGSVSVLLLCVPNGHILPAVGGLSYGFHSILTFTALYLVAGLIERATGQADTRQMRGLYAANSLLSVLFFVLILAVSGIPPFLGFWPKILLLQGFLGQGGDWLGAFAVLLNAFLTLIAGSRLWSHIFWRGTAERASLPFGALSATALLTLVIVALGLAPNLMIAAAQLAASDMLNPARYIASVGLAP